MFTKNSKEQLTVSAKGSKVDVWLEPEYVSAILHVIKLCKLLNITHK